MSAPDATTWGTIAGLTRWLDGANGASDGETSVRVMKVGEECGEAISAYIGMIGQNPRKGVTHSVEDVVAEVCDVVLTALVALARFHRDPTDVLTFCLSVRSDSAAGGVGVLDVADGLLELSAKSGRTASTYRVLARYPEGDSWPVALALGDVAAAGMDVLRVLGVDPSETFAAHVESVARRVGVGGVSAETSTGGAQEPSGAVGSAVGSPASNSSSSTAQNPNPSSQPGVAGTREVSQTYEQLANGAEQLGKSFDAMAETIREALRTADARGPAAAVALLRGYAEEAADA